MLLLHRDPFTERSAFKDAVWAREHHPGTIRKLVVSAPLDNAGPFVAQHERRFCPWKASRENSVIERGDSAGGRPHQDASIQHRWLGDYSTMRVKVAGGPTLNVLGEGKIESVGEGGAELTLVGEDSRTATLRLAEPGSSVTVKDKNGQIEYAG
jgi:hypothetical protein